MRPRQLLLAVVPTLLGCTSRMSRPAAADANPALMINAVRANPLLARSKLPFGTPPFDKIRSTDYEPALELRMREHLAEAEVIANQTTEPTFQNTIVALERSAQPLLQSLYVFYSILGANSNDTLQNVAATEMPKLSRHFDEINLNPKLFRRIEAIYARRDQLGLSAEDKRVLEQYRRDFVRSGALLGDSDKARVRAFNEEEARLTTAFQSKLLSATKNAGVIVDDRSQLDGLSDIEIDAAAEAAKGRGLSGKWLLPLQNTTRQPSQQHLRDRAMRERLYRASIDRAEQGDTSDTRQIVRRLAELRSARAALLGYPNHAAYVVEPQMSHTPDAVLKLLTDIATPAIRRAKEEQVAMQTLIDEERGGFKLEPWDWQYYAERVRLARYALEETQLKPYLELNRVLEDGVFYAANQLYGISFRERHDLPVYHPDVRVFEVIDADGTPLALFYADYFKRDNKNGGAWTNTFVIPAGLLGTRAVVTNVANFTKPAPGQPALLTFDDVIALFHEFGHALHLIFAKSQYPSLLGAPPDFGEFPSQFNEHWAFEPRVLAHYAKHYQTGAPMPDSLVTRFLRSRTFNQGFETTEYVAAALLDLSWHILPKDAPTQDVDAFESATLERYHFNEVAVAPRYRSSYFLHIWNLGYAANYGAYMWAEVLDHDAYAWFEEHGGLTRANGQRFRDLILARQNTMDLMGIYREFRGRDPRVDALLQNRGLVDKKISAR